METKKRAGKQQVVDYKDLLAQVLVLNFRPNVFVLLLDSREHDPQLVQCLSQLPWTRSCQLPAGDIYLIMNGRLMWVIERKGGNDLSNSVKTTRGHDQTFRSQTLPIPSGRILWLLEGVFRTGQWALPYASVVGKKANTLIRDKMNILQTSNTSDTCLHILKMIMKIHENFQVVGWQQDLEHQIPLLRAMQLQQDSETSPEKRALFRPIIANLLDVFGASGENQVAVLPPQTPQEIDYLRVIGSVRVVKGANWKPGDAYVNALAALRGMGVKRATVLSQQFPCLLDLVQHFQTCGKDKFLEDIAHVTVSKTRRLGPVLSQRVYELLTESKVPTEHKKRKRV